MSSTAPTTPASRQPGKRGPAPWPAATVRSRLVHTRLTPAEHDALAARANALGLTVSSYLQRLAATATRSAGSAGSTAA